MTGVHVDESECCYYNLDHDYQCRHRQVYLEAVIYVQALICQCPPSGQQYKKQRHCNLRQPSYYLAQYIQYHVPLPVPRISPQMPRLEHQCQELSPERIYHDRMRGHKPLEVVIVSDVLLYHESEQQTHADAQVDV